MCLTKSLENNNDINREIEKNTTRKESWKEISNIIDIVRYQCRHFTSFRVINVYLSGLKCFGLQVQAGLFGVPWSVYFFL